jgi:hypothetical protein
MKHRKSTNRNPRFEERFVPTAAKNPFSQQRIERLSYRFPDGKDWASNLSRLKQLNFRALVVGGYGTGKSTLIRELQSRFSTQEPAIRPITEPLMSVNLSDGSIDDSIRSTILLDVPRLASQETSGSSIIAGSRSQQRAIITEQLAELDSGTLLLVDGIERLTWLDRQRLICRTAAPSRVAGVVMIVHHRNICLRLPTWIETRPSELLVCELLEELLNEQPVTDRDTLNQRAIELFRRHRFNIRATLRQLFDEWPSVV